MLPDRHLHTSFSQDSVERPEVAIQTAIDLGMSDIYITDHYDIGFGDCWFQFDPPSYFETLSILKDRFKARINVHIGVEVNIGDDIKEELDALLRGYPWEYVIGSMHIVDGKDPYTRDRFDMDDESYYRLNFETTLRSLRACGGFDTLGHLDYCLRYGYTKEKGYKYETYADVLDEILKEIIRRDIALEVNTAALRKGLKYVHPYPEVLERYRQMGGRLLAMGSDAHAAKDIGYMFDETLEYLKQFGFSEANII